MSILLLTIALFVSLVLFLISGFPIAFCLMAVSVIFYLILQGPSALYLLFSVTMKAGTTDVYIAIPLYVLMAGILEFSGLGAALYDTMYKWFGGLRGGLAIGTIVICTLIGATTGSATTGIFTIGMLALPEMLKKGYDKRIAIGCIPFGGSLGQIIPPSFLMIIVGAFGGISIGKLFMGGVFPGIIAALLGSAYVAVRCFRESSLAPALARDARVSLKEKLSSLLGVLPTIILILLVLGTIYTGVATPTEAAGVGAFGAAICAAIYRRFVWSKLKEAAIMTLKLTSMSVWLIIGGTIFSSFMGSSGIGHYIGNALTGSAMSPMTIMIIMMVIPLIMGCFMDGIAISMILLPIFMPVVREIGIDPVWFGILFSLNIIIGLITPPFGFCLFYTRAVVPRDIGMSIIWRSALPYCLILVVVLILGIVFPNILIWLPNKMLS